MTKPKPYERTPEIREKNRQALLGRPAHNKGVPCSEETKEKISLSLIGRYRGSESPLWKGSDAGYTGKHEWIKREFGKAAEHLCAECLGPALHWHSFSGKHLRTLDDWVSVCPKHHFSLHVHRRKNGRWS